MRKCMGMIGFVGMMFGFSGCVKVGWDLYFKAGSSAYQDASLDYPPGVEMSVVQTLSGTTVYLANERDEQTLTVYEPGALKMVATASLDGEEATVIHECTIPEVVGGCEKGECEANQDSCSVYTADNQLVLKCSYSFGACLGESSVPFSGLETGDTGMMGGGGF